MTTKIKPCPFCGVAELDKIIYSPNLIHAYHICSDGKHPNIKFAASTFEEAVLVWNTRPTSPEFEKLKALLREAGGVIKWFHTKEQPDSHCKFCQLISRIEEATKE